MTKLSLVRLAGPKPALGEPCNGCGGCCLAVVCPAGSAILGLPEEAPGPCPALERQEARFVCGLVANPCSYAPVATAIYGAPAMSEAALLLISSGVGCDARALGEPRNEQMFSRIDREHARPSYRRRYAAARATWGVP